MYLSLIVDCCIFSFLANVSLYAEISAPVFNNTLSQNRRSNLLDDHYPIRSYKKGRTLFVFLIFFRFVCSRPSFDCSVVTIIPLILFHLLYNILPTFAPLCISNKNNTYFASTAGSTDCDIPLLSDEPAGLSGPTSMHREDLR